MLDELPYGDFIEIEGPDTEAIHDASRKLELAFSAAVPSSYLRLFEGFCQNYQLDPTQLTFSALEGTQTSAEELSVRAADKTK